MDNMVDELITFFTDKNKPDLLVTFHDKSSTVWETENLCRWVVSIQTSKVSIEHTKCMLLTPFSPAQTDSYNGVRNHTFIHLSSPAQQEHHEGLQKQCSSHSTLLISFNKSSVLQGPSSRLNTLTSNKSTTRHC